MRFLIKVAFWLSIVVLLLPSDPARQADDARASIGPFEALGAAQAAVEDATSFCDRKPEACEIGSQALNSFGQKAQHGAKLLYDYLSEHFADGRATGSIPRDRPGRDTLTPADLETDWDETRALRVPQPQRRPSV